LDVADEGADLNALTVRYGFMLDHCESWSGKGADIFGTVQKAFMLCDDYQSNTLIYDSDGLGAGVRGDGRVINDKRTNKLILQAFRGSGSVVNPTKPIPSINPDRKDRKNEDYFANSKAQAWWSLRVRFQLTYRAVVEGADYNPDDIISINSEIPEISQLANELSQPTYSVNNAGKVIVDKAPDGTRSPNLADSIMMSFAPIKREVSFFV
jgi:hypothetical protein